MKASVLHEYGPPKNLKYEEVPDPQPGPGEVLVHVSAIGTNPIDWKMRSGAAKDHFPVEFPGILGFDMAGTVRACGEGVTGFEDGDRVFAVGQHTYAELCVVKASDLARVPEGLELTAAASVALVSITADQLIRRAVAAEPGQTIVLTGATGSVGRCALFCASEMGVKVIAAVRKKQKDEALALGAVAAIDLDDEDEIAALGTVDAVADAVGGKVATLLLGKVKAGGRYGSLVGPPQDAALHPMVKVQPMSALPDAPAMLHYAEALRDGKLKVVVDRVLPLEDAAEAHTAGEKGGIGKIVLVP